MLVCNYNIDKVPVKLSAFHRQVFLSWSLIYKHNFSPHRYYIWNNWDILYKNTYLFLEYCQLVNAEGLLLSYKEFLSLYKVPVTPKDFAIVLDAIPSETDTAKIFRKEVVDWYGEKDSDCSNSASDLNNLDKIDAETEVFELATVDLALAQEEKPFLTLAVMGQRITFLCDTGACRTAICSEDAPQGIHPSGHKIIVRSASGHHCVERLSTPITLRHEMTEGEATVPVLISKLCPVNLLGRDVMKLLNITITPTDKGMKAQVVKNNMVICGEGDPHYWYSQDLLRGGLTDIPKALMELTDDVKSGPTKMSPDDLHCTLWYNRHPGPDLVYERALLRTTERTIGLKWLYYDSTHAAVEVELPTHIQVLYREKWSPHVALAKEPSGQWKDMGYWVSKGKKLTDWVTGEGGLQHRYRRKLNWRANCAPAVHISESVCVGGGGGRIPVDRRTGRRFKRNT
ncbi:unnamed protein product [Oncorhynchus mykiss]|uniref:Peptidase A2 domain-containing protein n=1 Tax=Oncorhynchus mykiss TaxID=8022 RepID=A0A060WJK7_ONCMY|nr:unnamed protein product [Oncorhynchus mykiss]